MGFNRKSRNFVVYNYIIKNRREAMVKQLIAYERFFSLSTRIGNISQYNCGSYTSQSQRWQTTIKSRQQ